MKERFDDNNFILELFEPYIGALNITDKKYEDIISEISEKSTNIKKYLSSDEAMELFNSLTILFFKAEGELTNLFFCEGFRLGMRLALECYSTKSKD